MGYGIELVDVFSANVAATGAQAMAAGNQQSLAIRATAGGAAAVTLEAVFTNFQDAGDFRIRSPRMHDDVNGIRLMAPVNAAAVVANEGFANPLYSQDLLTVEAVFTVAPTLNHVSQAGLLVVYDDVPGIAGNYRSWAEVAPNIVQYLALPVTATGSATGGQWGNGVAINSTVDVFKANTLYAVIGYIAQAGQGLWALQGVDVGNLLIGGPIGNQVIDQRRYFAWMSEQTGKPCIPVINSQNKTATTVQIADQAASTAREITLVLAQLSA